MANGQRGGRRRGNNGTSGAPQPPGLAPQLFSELNATFYLDDPSEYLLTKIEALSLLLAPDEALAPAYAATRTIGVTRLDATDVPSRTARDRYIRTEAVLVVHHASEMLLRLYFAHTEKQDCPWLGMAASTNFADFKASVGEALTSGFDRDAIALVFLGGTSRTDAAIAVEDTEFEDGVAAIQLLLQYAAQTVLDESFLYNAAKHGLTVVQTGDDARSMLSAGADSIQLHQGSQFAYVHKQQYPNAPKGTRQWHLSLTHTLPDQDLGVAILIQRAVSSLWDVARRRYTGESGELHLISTAQVRDVIYGPVVESGQQVRTNTQELQKKDKDGNILGGMEIKMYKSVVPDAQVWERGASAECPLPRRVALPARSRDKQIISTTNRSLLPISPKWSSRV